MRAVYLLAVAGALVLTACGAGTGTRAQPIRFGLTGGNIVGYTVSIAAGGRVSIRGRSAIGRRMLAVSRVSRLGREIKAAHLARSRVCPGSIPDVAARFIRAGGRTFTLRGACEPRFQRVWSALLDAVGPLPK